MVAYEFLSLIEHGERFYTRVGVDVAFEARVVQVWADDGPSSHAANLSLAELLDGEWEHLEHASAMWLVPHLRQLEAGADPTVVRANAAAEYRERHGQDAVSFVADVPDSLL